MKRRRCSAAFIGLVLVACGARDSELHWTEEVKLISGEVVQVTRSETIEHYSDPGYSEARIAEATLIIKPRSSPSLPELKVSEYPVAVGYDLTGTYWFVVTHLETCREIRATPAKSGYYEYVLKDGLWDRQDVRPSRHGLKANLLLNNSITKKGGVITIEEKEAADASASIPKFMKEVFPKVPC
jgi:hypothetical protein